MTSQVVGYALLGAIVFRAVESPHEARIQSQVTAAREQAVAVAWNATFRFLLTFLPNFFSFFFPREYFTIIILNWVKTRQHIAPLLF